MVKYSADIDVCVSEYSRWVPTCSFVTQWQSQLHFQVAQDHLYHHQQAVVYCRYFCLCLQFSSIATSQYITGLPAKSLVELQCYPLGHIFRVIILKVKNDVKITTLARIMSNCNGILPEKGEKYGRRKVNGVKIDHSLIVVEYKWQMNHTTMAKV